jgi:low affinity Fe/Cu permease
MKPEMDAKEHERTVALLRLLSLGNKEIEQGKFRDAEDVFAELDMRIAEDDATPHDTVAWESIKAEAQTRWKR